MSAEAETGSARDAAVDRFFEAARKAAADDRYDIVVASADLLAIADDADLRGRFRERFKQLNSPDLQANIRDYLGALANRLERAADHADIRIDLVDRAALAPSATAAVAGLVALIGTGGAAAPFLLGGGLLGLIASAGGRTLMKFAGHRDRFMVRQVRLLLDSLK